MRIYKAAVNVADLDRNQFLDANLTLAQHPSETQERMMLRLLAWIKYADERLQFTRGLSSDDEPELWLLNDHLGVDLWIELTAALYIVAFSAMNKLLKRMAYIVAKLAAKGCRQSQQPVSSC